MGNRKEPAKRNTYHHGDLRAELIAAATKLVEKHGSAGFSLREAARSVGVDAAACYRHFRDRQDVLVAIAQGGFLKLASLFTRERARLRSEAPREQLAGLARSYVSFALRHPAEFRIMFGESGLDSRDARLRAPELDQSAYEQLEVVVAAYSAASALSVTEPTLVLSLWAASHGVARLALDGAVRMDEASWRDLLDKTVDALLRGILA